ncbi:MAG: prepilin-type N-terminal cleavage/methylation domain-containing protein, partial [Desulfobacteraceae bacterium]|nr:prepilin-type N-terminal cleavage/methylation domain-containing protein [Desulfobacteraceae bacterium]
MNANCLIPKNNISRIKKRTPNPLGFTLVELMVSIAVVAVLTAAAVPATIAFQTRHGLQYATDELYGDIQLARLRAARNNQRCRIVFNQPAPNQYTIRDVDNNGLLLGVFKIGNL